MAATSTLPNSQPEETDNPGQDEFDKIIGRSFSPDDERKMEDRAKDGAIDDNTGTPSREDLSDAEQELDGGSAGSFYRPQGQPGLYPGVGRFSLRGYMNRRRAIYGGGMIGTLIALIMALTFSSGPLQFIHIAQLEQRFHFSHQQNASNDRMGRLYRFARTGNVGETRLGWLGSKMHAAMLADLEKIGLKPHYSSVGGVFDSFEIDRSNPDSPFKDMSNEELKAAMAARGVDPNAIEFGAAEGKKGLPTAKISVSKYKGRRAGLKFLSSEAGTSNIPSPIRYRVMARYGLANWHPLNRADAALNQKLSVVYDKLRQSRQEQLKNGMRQGELAAGGAQQQDNVKDPKTGKDTTQTTNAPGESGPLDSGKANKLLSGIKDSKSLKVGGALATGVGLVCTVREVNTNMGVLRNSQVIAPLMRMGLEAVAVGNQLMTGSDVSSTEVSFLAKNFNEVNSKGNVVSTWNQSASINAKLGKSGGKDIDAADGSQPAQPDVKDALRGGVPDWISWTDSVPGIGKLCSGTGQFLSSAIGFTVSVFSGGLASTVGGSIAGSIGGQLFIDKLSHFLAGESVNVLATGAEWGNNVDYGSRLAANSMALQQGGTELSQAQSSQLDAIENTKSQAEFNSKNIAYKLFNPYDERSAVSKVVDGSSPSFSQNLNRTAGMFLSSGKNFGNIFKIFSPKANAAPKPFDYGFPEYGFSTDDLNNPSVEDPYANAEAAAAILNGPNQTIYIKKAHNCFGVDIKQIPDPDNGAKQLWDVVPVPTADETANPYTDDYQKTNHCSDNSDPNWLKIRFFIMDTGTMEGYACYKGDDQSCQNDGFGDSSASGSTATTTTGSTIDLPQAFQDSTSVACADGTKDLGIQDGYHDGQIVKIRICAVSNIPSTSEESNGGYGVSGAGGNLVVNSRISGAAYAMAQAAAKEHQPLYASSGFRTMQHQQALFSKNPDPNRVARPGYSNHQMGLAIDFAGLPSSPGPVPGNPVWEWLVKNAGGFGYKNYPQEAWHWSVTGN
jgi:hypothetical protein